MKARGALRERSLDISHWLDPVLKFEGACATGDSSTTSFLTVGRLIPRTVVSREAGTSNDGDRVHNLSRDFYRPHTGHQPQQFKRSA